MSESSQARWVSEGMVLRQPVLDESSYLRPASAERVITAGRLLLAMVVGLTLQLPPAEPAGAVPLIGALAVAYIGYAAVLMALTWTRRSTVLYLPLTTHIVDLGLFSVFIYLTGRSGSPFFLYLVFGTVCGAIRWHGRGALMTGLAALAAYLIVSLVPAPSSEPPFDPARFITRCAHLGLLTVLLVYLGRHQRRLQAEIASLAAWPRQLPANEDAALSALLANAAAGLRVPRVVLAWDEGDEPFLRIASLVDGRFELVRERPDTFGSLVAAPLERSSFVCEDVTARQPFVMLRTPEGFLPWRGEPVSGAFASRYGIRSLLAICVKGESTSGYLFALDRGRLSVDDLLMGDVVGRLVAGTLEHLALIARLRESAAAQERLRLARELHDGVLQSLTAFALQAGQLRRLVSENPVAVAHKLATLEQTIVSEQRGLRLLLQDLNPERGTAVDPGQRLRETVDRVARQWNVHVPLVISRELPTLDARLVHEICRMTQEAVANAARHGGARQIDVELSPVDGHRVRLQIGYEGAGFSTFSGPHDLAALSRLCAGPRSLKERVTALGGDLLIDSRADGATIRIVIG